MKDYKLLYLEWIDVISDPDHVWKDEESTDDFFEREDNIAKQTGWLISEDKDYINIVGCYMPGEDVNITLYRTKIPKKWILKRIDLTKHIK